MKDLVAGDNWIRRESNTSQMQSAPTLCRYGGGKTSRGDPGYVIERALLNDLAHGARKVSWPVYMACCSRGGNQLHLNLCGALPGRFADSGAHETSQTL